MNATSGSPPGADHSDATVTVAHIFQSLLCPVIATVQCDSRPHTFPEAENIVHQACDAFDAAVRHINVLLDWPSSSVTAWALCRPEYATLRTSCLALLSAAAAREAKAHAVRQQCITARLNRGPFTNTSAP